MQSNVKIVTFRVSFSAGCMVGVSEGCGGEVIALGWLNFSFALLGALTFSTLMRYSEGSNYVIIVLVSTAVAREICTESKLSSFFAVDACIYNDIRIVEMAEPRGVYIISSEIWDFVSISCALILTVI